MKTIFQLDSLSVIDSICVFDDVCFFDWIIKKQLGLSLRFCLRITSYIYKELKLQHYFFGL